PRIHYALNCAAVGCPNLQPVPFTAENSDPLLESAARQFINDPRGAHVRDGRLTVSKIYNWFAADFGGSEAGVIAHIFPYAAPALRAALQEARGIDRYEYDWRLNGAPPP
ncbi:MAG: DUF547 domain-containing protein, partial [SAR324 cluster bacterium]|nr:DUF547 domain-containing protein [SAR324 cluster bacterium]